jgi:hypothetical protein
MGPKRVDEIMFVFACTWLIIFPTNKFHQQHIKIKPVSTMQTSLLFSDHPCLLDSRCPTSSPSLLLSYKLTSQPLSPSSLGVHSRCHLTRPFSFFLSSIFSNFFMMATVWRIIFLYIWLNFINVHHMVQILSWYLVEPILPWIVVMLTSP